MLHLVGVTIAEDMFCALLLMEPRNTMLRGNLQRVCVSEANIMRHLLFLQTIQTFTKKPVVK